MKIYAAKFDHVIEQYIGKGVWILASSWRWYQKAYIQPLKYDHGDMIYHRVWLDILEDRLVVDEDLVHEYTTSWEDVDIAYPLDIMTDDEMMEFHMKNRNKYFGG